MAYTLVKSNGTTITVADNSLDSTYSIRLVGKNRTNYGAPLNENFFKLMENFASASEPTNPQIGQIWWDSGNKLLKVRTGASTWKTVSGTMVTEPAEPIIGDLWYDTVAKQLKIYNGSQWQVVGTSVTAAGTSGFIPESFTDSGNTAYTVSSIYANGFRVAVVSANSIIGTGQTGFTNVYPGINFNTSHGNLATLNGNLSGASATLSASVTAGSLTVSGDATLGLNNSLAGLRKLDIRNTDTALDSGSLIRLITTNFTGNGLSTSNFIKYRDGRMALWNDEPSSNASMLFIVGITESMRINSNGNLGIGTATPAYKLDVSGTIGATSLITTANVSTGNLITSNVANVASLIVSGTSNLGAVGNVTITGGTTGQVLTTNGLGVLSWSTVSGGGGGSGTVNSGTATHLAYYASSTNAVSSTGGNLVWNGTNLLTVTGNISAANVTVSATGNIATLEVTTLANVRATTTATSTTTGALRVAGGIGAAGNIFSGGILNVTGNANVGNIGAAIGSFTGLVTATGGFTTTANVAAGNAAITSALTAGTLAVSGTTNLGAVGNVTITGGSVGQVLTTNGLGVLSWSTVSGGGGGSGTVGSGATNALAYYSTSGTTVAGTTNLSWDNSLYLLTVIGTANATTLNISGLTTTNSANITATTAASSTTTGALRVAGGIGAAGNIYSGGILNVTGNANVGNIGATNAVFTGAISGSTTLNVTGNANVGNIGATAGVFSTVTGTIQTASQTNITAVGTLGTLSVTGNANVGNIGATAGLFGSVTGTIQTAAQPNVTSVGTLTGLTVSGGTNLSTVSGNVGIGTASPLYKLDVTGTVRLSSFGAGTLSANASGVISSVKTLPVGIAVVTTSSTLSSGVNYIVGANSITLTLPSGPAQGDKIGFVPRPNITSYTVARNGANIMALAENLTIDLQRPFALVYDDATNGWLIAHA